MSDPGDVGAAAPAIDPARVLADLRALAELTGDSGGAQRVCWTTGWQAARDLLRERLAEIEVDEIDVDQAGNLWARLPGSDRGAPALVVGSHLDSVPDGGRLDGALGVMAGLGALRAWAGSGITPPRDLVLLDFADEEGSRFGRSLFGSSALAGTMVPAELDGLTDADGDRIAAVLAEFGVDPLTAPEAHNRLDSIGTYVELHIEQGPVLEGEAVSCSAVSGCAGVERHLLTFRGQTSHAGTTPMDRRRDAGLAAAETALELERIARLHGGVATTGRIDLDPGVITAVAGAAELSVDLRHPEREPLAEMLSEALLCAAQIADERRCIFGGRPIWQIEPIGFDPQLIELARKAVAAAGGRGRPIASGALHDAAEMARCVPTAMIFAASIGGVSHAKEEDSSESDLAAAIGAFSSLVSTAV